MIFQPEQLCHFLRNVDYHVDEKNSEDPVQLPCQQKPADLDLQFFKLFGQWAYSVKYSIDKKTGPVIFIKNFYNFNALHAG